MIETLLQLLLNGAASGGVYALVALGYTLVFSVLGVINFAQGALFSVGGYLTFLLMGGKIGVNGALPGWGLPGGLPFWLALLVAAAGSGLVGLLVERVAFAPLRRRNAEPLLALITSLGAGVVVVNLLQLLMGAEGYAFPHGTDALGGLPGALMIAGARIRTIQLLLLLTSAGAVLALSLWLERSKGGRALRAVAEDATTAQLLGINSEAMVRLAFFLSGALAGLGGGLIGVSVSLPGPYFGIGYGLKGLAVLVLGGLGSVPGAIAGGLLMGLAEALVPSAASGWRDALAFAILFAVLLLRPSGLLGRRTVEKV
ncbi:branched-chain amino acid ABC transporter permease [Synechococcus sp. HJ21-Hayes]|uniref:branched-chain amino acid ABC transporter permease n=1 Tax=unclassified Synechococcus TaxID=2626047 RepID=UPI0020CE10E3|nr:MULTISPECIES: branched-chain amino acid ABC transporter permease [unclassified Synechococcus]MCP9832133.1 branched-chain amino acid ABC transporter permease [Synechococcus sp. JJ3a-Johnson]MCP9853988.1 branched-chain amino acid ABC transporter permease [Synechococcus sp. HJ21-Hayes]